MKATDKNIIYYAFITIMYLLLFQNFIQKYISVFRYFDEFLAVITIPLILLNVIKKHTVKIKKYDLYIVIMLLIICLLGLYASFKYRYQPINIAFMDIILVYKFFLVYYLGSMLNQTNTLHKYKNNIVNHLKIITILFLILTCINYVFNIFPSSYRYGIMVNTIFYGQPTNLVASCIFIIATMIIFEEKINYKYIFILLFIIASTLRMKAFIFILIFLVISLYVDKSNKKITISKIGLIMCVCFFLTFNQIEYYFFTSDDIARGVLLETSIEIANDHFPFGAGFATFASYFSAIQYSPIYAMYHIQNVHGLTKSNPAFISDTFWPMLIGQFGYIGAILYFLCIVLIFKKIQKSFSVDNKYKYIAKVSVLAYLMISSTSESAFVNPLAISLALILGI